MELWLSIVIPKFKININILTIETNENSNLEWVST